MKKFIFSLVLLIGLGGVSYAAVQIQPSINTPKSDKGAEVDALLSGYKYYRSATIAENVVCTGRCLLVELYMATGANTTTVWLRDTSVANGSGGLMFPKRRFEIDSAAARPQIARPIRASNGISVQTPEAAGEVVVVYLDNI